MPRSVNSIMRWFAPSVRLVPGDTAPSPASRAERWGVGVLLAFVFAVLHRSALDVGWTFDDPAHLHFAATHSIWEYFTHREVMLRQSYAHITPWNVLFYDLGLPWAGLNARGHHLHMLAVLWATAWATWALLRRWLPLAAALAGALLFAAMPATVIVAHMLMTGHYAYGLLFSVLALHAWAKALEPPTVGRRSRAAIWALLAAALYALACLCKELYAPLPAVLLCLPAAGVSVKRRLLLFLPVLGVALGYASMRLWLFGGAGVGGHAMLAMGTSTAAPHVIIKQVRELLWGLGGAGWSALALSAALIWLAWYRRRRTSTFGLAGTLLLGASAVALLLPIAPLALAAELEFGHHRLIFVLAWALAVALAWQLRWAGRLGWLLCVCLLGVLIGQQRLAAAYVDGYSRPFAMHYQFMLEKEASDLLVPRRFERVGYLRDIASTRQLLTGRSAPMVLGDEEQVGALGQETGARAHAWADECACLKSLGSAGYVHRVQAYREQLAKGDGLPLSLELSLVDGGARKSLSWRLVGQPNAQSAWLDVPDVGRLHIRLEGQFAFGTDNTLPLPDPMKLRFGVQTVEGAVIRSPLLQISLSGSGALRWQSMAPSGLPAAKPAASVSAAAVRGG